MNNVDFSPHETAMNTDVANIHLDTHLKVLRVLQARPNINQRELAAELGVSLGKTNFCLKALLDKGLVKMQSFKRSQNKLAYAYLLTSAGMAQKAELTAMFLRRKQLEFVELKAEIDKLQLEVADVVEEISL
jgi:EPS-associated MarR family transcriptional regulator